MRIITARGGTGACLVLLFISCWTLYFRLGALPLSGADEPRYARISQEMLGQGRWVTPVLEGKPWLEKPPLYYWITIPFLSAFGSNETTSRLGTATLALFTSLVVLWLGATLWSRLAGLLGAAILLTSFGFAGYGRSASTDMPLTAFMTLALAILAAVAAGRNPGRWKLWIGYVSLGLAVLAKGPVAVVLVGGVAIAFWCFDERGGTLRRWRPAEGLAIAAAVSLPWYWLAFRQNGFSFLSVFFINHNFVRYVSDLHHHSQPFYYYGPVLLAMLFPWSGWFPLLAPDSISGWLRRWREWSPSNLFLICWILFPLVFFSCSTSKLAGYILPVLPPFALLLGSRFARWWDSPPMPRIAWPHLALTAALAVAAPIAFGSIFDGQWGAGAWIACAVLLPGILAFRFARGGAWKKVFLATCVQAILLVITVAVAAFPILGNHYSTRGIAREALRLRRPGEPIVTYRFFHHTLYYYTGYQISEELQDRASLEYLVANRPGAIVVTEARTFDDIRRMTGLTATLLYSQSNFRLARIESTKSRAGP